MDQELKIKYEVEVETFGDAETQTDALLAGLARGIYHWGAKNFKIRVLGTEQWYVYDPYGDDAGNHPGHLSPVIPVPK